jgi:hypothetical protein
VSELNKGFIGFVPAENGLRISFSLKAFHPIFRTSRVLQSVNQRLDESVKQRSPYFKQTLRPTALSNPLAIRWPKWHGHAGQLTAGAQGATS